MEIVTIIWVIIFFLFSITLIFIWSKLYLLNKRVQSVALILNALKGLDEQFSKFGSK